MRKTYTIQNIETEAVWLQIDWWADLLYLLPEEKVSFVIYLDNENSDDFEFEKDKNNYSLFINNVHEYFILEGEKEIHHQEYGSNVIGWAGHLCKESSLTGSIVHPSKVENGS